MDDVTRRDAVRLVAAGAVLAAGATAARADDKPAKGKGGEESAERVQQATAEEKKRWDEYRARVKLTEIPIPYVVTIGAVNIAGIFFLKDPIENSSTDGVCAGAVNGTYHLDKDHLEARLYDPTGNVLRVDLVLSFQNNTLKGRLCTRRFDGTWKCGDYVTLASW